MALRPARLPRWATRPYGGDETRWDEAVRQCSRILYAWARTVEPHFYSELSELVTAIDWPEGPHTHEGQQMGYLLGQVSMAELDPVEDRPLISALVIGKDENMPGGGFWTLLAELGISVAPTPEARLAFWIKELQRCRETYG